MAPDSTKKEQAIASAPAPRLLQKGLRVRAVGEGRRKVQCPPKTGATKVNGVSYTENFYEVASI